MPLYEYKCVNPECESFMEHIEDMRPVSMADRNCDKCGASMEKVIRSVYVLTQDVKFRNRTNVPRSKFFDTNPLEYPNG